jgi:hypothetical protein
MAGPCDPARETSAMSIQMIPLNKLRLSPHNVRKSGAEDGLDELVWTCNGFVPATYLIMPLWLRTRAG